MLTINFLRPKISNEFVPLPSGAPSGKSRKCAECQKFKTRQEFEGTRSVCRQCRAIRNREYRRANRADRHIELPESKKCWRCRTVRPARFFSIDRSRHDHLDHTCRWCKRTMNKIAGTGRNNVPRYLNNQYGLTQAQYDSMLVAQDGKCAICAVAFDQSGRGTRGQVDHNHATGKVRSLLCSRCNGKLGGVEDSEFLVKALVYLKNHREIN